MDRRIVGLCGLLVAALAVASPARAIVYVVNSVGDDSDANPNDGMCETQVPGVCTLRAAVEQANVTGGQIQIAAMAITVTSTISIKHDMSLVGAGMHATSVGGNAMYQVFSVGDLGVSTPVVSISDMTLRDGHYGTGGAIYVVQSQLTVTRCLFTNNYAVYGGGAILGDYLSDLRIHDSIFTDNHSPGDAGAVYMYNAYLTMSGTAIHANTGSSGAALALHHTNATLTNVTIGGNTASLNGGGIALFENGTGGSSLTLESTTVAGNRATAGFGGGIYVENTNSAASIRNTIVAYNTRVAKGTTVVSSDCSGTLASGGNSIVAGICTAVTGSYSTANPLLGPLQDNGGASGPTYALTSGSPGINGGSLGGCPLVDQRGVHRQTGGPCDMGAYEHAPCGDVNGDGTVNVADVFFVVNYLFAGGPVPPGLANVNGDSSLDVSDVFYLVNSLFAGGPSPSCPGT